MAVIDSSVLANTPKARAFFSGQISASSCIAAKCSRYTPINSACKGAGPAWVTHCSLTIKFFIVLWARLEARAKSSTGTPHCSKSALRAARLRCGCVVSKDQHPFDRHKKTGPKARHEKWIVSQPSAAAPSCPPLRLCLQHTRRPHRCQRQNSYLGIISSSSQFTTWFSRSSGSSPSSGTVKPRTLTPAVWTVSGSPLTSGCHQARPRPSCRRR